MTPAAAKGEKLFLLAAALLAAAGALLAPAPVEASRYLPQALEPVSAPQASLEDLAGTADHHPALPALTAADRLDLVDLAAGARLEVQRLGLHLAPGEPALARKLASGGQTWALEDNIRPISEMGVKTRRPTFQGLWTDPVTGLAYARARWYDARNASWLSEDPLLDADSPNLYAFVGWGPHVGTDPLGLVAGIYSETGSPADYFGSLDLETGFAPFDYTALNLVNSVVNTFGKFGNLTLNLAYCAGQVEEAGRDLMIDQLGFSEADVSFLEVYFAAEPAAGRQLTEAGAQAVAKLRQVAARRGSGGSLEQLREAWKGLRRSEVPATGGGIPVTTGVRAGGSGAGTGEALADVSGDVASARPGARLPPRGTPERALIEKARKEGISAKKAEELADIVAGGKGSGVWTEAELEQIRTTGRFPADARWHHDPTVANRPDLAADPSVVTPVRGGNPAHLEAHGGDWRLPR